MQILIATDGSADGNAGIELLCSASARDEAAVTVLVVVPSLPVPGRDLQPLKGSARAGDSDVAYAIARHAADLLSAAGYAATPMVHHGDPAEEILAVARSTGAHLVILGLQGVGRLRRLLVGSVASRVARLSPTPVLLTREPASLANALVAIDGSPGVEQAVASLTRMPNALVSRATALRVTSDPAGSATLEPLDEQVSSTLVDAGIEVAVRQEGGNEVDAILRVAEEEQSTLIALGASNVLVDGEPLLGSTATGVLDRSPCSVLIGRATRA